MGHSCNFEESIKVGPWGGTAGSYWSFKAKGGITEITISHSEVIDSIILKSDDLKGNIDYSRKFGGTGGKTDKVSLDWPREYLTAISGTLKTFLGYYVTRSLCLHTNRTKYGPYGKRRGDAFNFPLEGSLIVGFHGRAGEYIDAIGVFVKPSISLYSCQELVLSQKVNNLMIVDVPRSPGPWGGSKGNQWDDGVFTAVQQIDVHVGNGIIHAIQFLYQSRDGKSVWSKRHGGDGGDMIQTVKMNCSSENLVGIMGFFGPVEGNGGSEALRSITFYSNKNKYGPFGKEIGTAFNSTVSNGVVLGFHGRSGAFLDALGVHMEYF